MHDADNNDRHAPSLPSTKLHPFLRAPPPGRWGFWHGDHARLTVDLARAQGQRLPSPPEVALPSGFPPPVSEGAWWSLQVEDRTFFIREDQAARLGTMASTSIGTQRGSA